MLQKDVRQAPEYFVARQMAKRIIVAFEKIDVKHNQRKRRVVASCALHFLFQALCQGAVVVEAGQGIGHGDLFQALDRILQLLLVLVNLCLIIPTLAKYTAQFHDQHRLT